MSDSEQPLVLGDIRVDSENSLPYLVVQDFIIKKYRRLYLNKKIDLGHLHDPSSNDIFICNIKETIISIGQKALKHAGIA